ncbi:MAG: DNA glycosylase AlkZ-like family protein, partial [Vicinamibacterales bacterium]
MTDIAQSRLRNQRLSGGRFARPEDAVSWLGAVQAQEYADTKWALALRTRRTTDAAIERALTKGAILRTHVLRPTWHLVAAADIRWMLALTGP